MKNISMKLMGAAVCVASFAGLDASAAKSVQVGIFAPPNSRRIPVSKQIFGTGLTEKEFNSVLDRVQTLYTPVVKAKGGKLKINRKWTDDTVNASASQSFGTWTVNMYGGLARHSMITPDGFMLVACHELGHHLGGAPKVPGFFGPGWASNEGQSDYFGTLQCMKNILRQDDNEAVMRGVAVDTTVVTRCRQNYSTSAEQALCERVAMAGFATASVLGDLGGTLPINFDTPDTKIVGSTDDDHPAAQCRLDTYFAGAICPVSSTATLDKKDYKPGTCNETSGHDRIQRRPQCWFAPKVR